MTTTTASTKPVVELSNGVEMPAVALGTAPLMTSDEDSSSFNPLNSFEGFLPERCCRSVHALLEMKASAQQVHIDTALYYQTQPHIRTVLGHALGTGQIHRSDVFLTTKIFHMHDPFGQCGFCMPEDPNYEMTYEDVHKFVWQQFKQSLHECGVGYFDLVILHWPGRNHPNTTNAINAQHRLAAWNVLEEAYAKGWTRSVGVSNFSEYHLEELQALNEAKKGEKAIRPHVNQIEASVFVQHTGILEYCLKKGIVCQAYSPLGRGVMQVTTNDVVTKIASRHDKDAGQVAMKYLLQKGYGSVVCWTTNVKRVKSNHELFDFQLSDSEMKELDGLNRSDGLGTWGLLSPYTIP